MILPLVGLPPLEPGRTGPGRAEQDQAACAALAGGGGEAGLGAADLAGEGGALSALGLLERFFLRCEFLREGCLPGQELLQFFLWRGGPHPSDRCSSQLRWNPGS